MLGEDSKNKTQGRSTTVTRYKIRGDLVMPRGGKFFQTSRDRPLLGALCLIWFFRELSAMPDSNDPNILAFNTIKKAVGRYNDFAKRKVRKLGQYPAGLRKLSEPG